MSLKKILFSASSTGEEAAVAGSLYAWGNNGPTGSLGINLGLGAERSSPVQVGALSDWSQISVGANHTLAVKSNKTLWAWGGNDYGQLGANNRTARSSPVQIGSLSNWSQVAASGDSTSALSCAVKTNGTLWAWGSNSFGGIGDNTTITRSSPVQIGSDTNWKSVAVGIGGISNGFYVIAIKTNGTLWSWGRGSLSGQNDSVDRSSPVQIGSLSNWSQIAVSKSHILAIKTDGTLWGWGDNNGGKLGLNSTATLEYSSPVQIGALTTWKNIGVSSNASYAIRTNGTLWSWGDGFRGELGSNTNITRSSPVQVGSLSNWSQIATTSTSAFSIKTDGTLWSWGQNQDGVLGLSITANTIRRSSPVQVGALTTWKKIATASSSASTERTFGII